MQGFHDDGIKMEQAIPSTHLLVDLFCIKISGNVASNVAILPFSTKLKLTYTRFEIYAYTRFASLIRNFNQARAYSGQISKISLPLLSKRKNERKKEQKIVFCSFDLFSSRPWRGNVPFCHPFIRMEVSQVHSTNFQTLFFRKKKKKERKEKERDSLIFRATITPSVTPLPKENTIPARNYETSGRDEGDSRNRTGRDLGQGQASLLENVKNVCTRCRCRSIATRCFNSRPRYTDGAAHWQPSTPLKSRGGSGIVASFPLPTLSTSIRFWPRCSRTFWRSTDFTSHDVSRTRLHASQSGTRERRPRSGCKLHRWPGYFMLLKSYPSLPPWWNCIFSARLHVTAHKSIINKG